MDLHSTPPTSLHGFTDVAQQLEMSIEEDNLCSTNFASAMTLHLDFFFYKCSLVFSTPPTLMMYLKETWHRFCTTTPDVHEGS